MVSKPVTELTREDLQTVLGHEESDRLDFKRDPYGRSDDDTREMLRDITSFANAGGGYLLLGVEEDGEARASAIVGIENADQEASRMVSQCRACIEEQIIGLNFGLVSVEGGKHVLVWRIPRSTRAPHMVTHKGLYQCWIRHGRQKDKMTIEEIREACLRTENVRRNLEGFLSERRGKILAQIGDRPHLVVMATPLVVKDEVIDTADKAIRQLMIDPPNLSGTGFTVACGRDDVRPSLYGLTTGTARPRRLDVHRNGHLEFRVPIVAGRGVDPGRDDTGTEYLELHPFMLACYPRGFLEFAAAVAEHASIREPLVVALSMFNARGLALRNGHPDFMLWREDFDARRWVEDQHLDIDAMQLSYPLDPGKAAKLLADRVWNAFGFEGCTVLDAQGNLIRHRR